MSAGEYYLCFPELIDGKSSCRCKLFSTEFPLSNINIPWSINKTKNYLLVECSDKDGLNSPFIMDFVNKENGEKCYLVVKTCRYNFVGRSLTAQEIISFLREDGLKLRFLTKELQTEERCKTALLSNPDCEQYVKIDYKLSIGFQDLMELVANLGEIHLQI